MAKKGTTTSFLLSLPKEILIHLITFIPPIIVSTKLRLVNKELQECCETEIVWKSFCRQYDIQVVAGKPMSTGPIMGFRDAFQKAFRLTWDESSLTEFNVKPKNVKKIIISKDGRSVSHKHSPFRYYSGAAIVKTSSTLFTFGTHVIDVKVDNCSKGYYFGLGVIEEDELKNYAAGLQTTGDFVPTGKVTKHQWMYFSTGKIASFEKVMTFESSAARHQGFPMINPGLNIKDDHRLRKGDKVRIVVDMNEKIVQFYRNKKLFKEDCNFKDAIENPKLVVVAYLFSSSDSLTISKYRHKDGLQKL